MHILLRQLAARHKFEIRQVALNARVRVHTEVIQVPVYKATGRKGFSGIGKILLVTDERLKLTTSLCALFRVIEPLLSER